MTLPNSQRIKPGWISPLLSAVMAFIVGLFLYSANTPLGPCYSSDNSIYITMGTALANGFRPYVDIFDHKGPVLYILQWIPQLFGGGFNTITIFIQEVVFLFLCLRVLCIIAQKFFPIHPLIPQLLYLAYISSLVGEGNLTEEYCNLFILISLYCILLFFSDDIHSRSRLIACSCVIGLCFTICFLTRANNALPIAGLVIGITVFLIFSGNFHELVLSIVGFFFGILLILIPVFLWLHANNAVAASFQASIVHNLLYSETTSEYSTGRFHTLIFDNYGHAALLFAFFSVLGAFVCLYKKHSRALFLPALISAGCSLVAGFISHKYYDHYLIIGIPLAVLGNLLFLSLFNGPRKKVISALLLIPSLIWLTTQCFLANHRRLESTQNITQFFEDAQYLSSQIPENERNRVYPYRVEPKWYVAARVLPCNRYYFLQETLADANPAIMDEIVESFHTRPPLWLVIYNKERIFSPPYDPRIQEIIETLYQETDTAGDYRLMQLILPE